MNHAKAAAHVNRALADPLCREILLRKLNLVQVRDAGELPMAASVAILMPTFRPLAKRVREAWQNMIGYTRTFCECSEVAEFESSLVHVARNALLSEAYRSPLKFTHFLFGDDDNVPAQDSLVSLLKLNLPLVSGLYISRRDPPEPVAYEMDAFGMLRAITGYRRGSVVEVEGCGAGFMLVRRDAVEAVRDYYINCGWEAGLYGAATEMANARLKKWEDRGEAAWFRFLDTPGGTSFGEDISFCVQARACGIIPKVATAVEIGHLGEKVWMPGELAAPTRANVSLPESTISPMIEEISAPSDYCPEPKRWRMFDLMTAEVEVLELLAALVRATKPALIVDTGSFEGWSAIYMGRAAAEYGGRVVTIELDEKLYEKTADHVESAGLSATITCLNCSSLDYHPPEQVGLLFSDSGIDVRLAEIDHFLPSMTEHGLLAMHDVGCAPQLWEGLAKHKLLRPLFLPSPRGLCVAQKVQ